MKTVCIYHQRDLDGYCSAAIVKKWFHETQTIKSDAVHTIEFIGFDYGRPLPDLSKADKIIMCDISFPKEEMLRLHKSGPDRLIWLDHHISAINEIKFEAKDYTLYGEIEGLRDTNFAACEITWRYLFPDRAMPQTVRMLGEYDSWRNKDMVRWDQIIMPFQWGMRLLCNSFETFPMRLINGDINDLKEINSILEQGLLILEYQQKQNEGLCRLTFAKEFKGLRAICLNASGTGSQTFKSVWDPKKYDIMITFYYNGHHDFFTVSLYSDKPEVDCSVIAKSLGGGGHFSASGFQIKDFKDIFDK